MWSGISLRHQESLVMVCLRKSECGQGVSEDQDCIVPAVYRIRKVQSGEVHSGLGWVGQQTYKAGAVGCDQ